MDTAQSPLALVLALLLGDVPSHGEPRLKGFLLSETGHDETAKNAAVIVLRVLRGAFTSTADMSCPQGVQEPAKGAQQARNPANAVTA